MDYDVIKISRVEARKVLEDIKKYVIQQCKNDNKQESVLKNVNVILNRLKNKGIIKTEYKGVYYKPIISMFGAVPLNTNKLRKLKYLEDKDGNIKGYIVGAKLFNKLGLTTLVPNVTDIVTNECKYHKQYDEKLRTYITKPKIEITNENYRYLQFIDILDNKDNANELVLNELKNTFRPEFINRIDEIIVFNSLKKAVVGDIVDKIVKELNERLSQNYLHIEVTKEAKEKIINEAYDERYGARPIRRYITKNIETLISHEIIAKDIKVGSTLIVDINNNEEFVIKYK